MLKSLMATQERDAGAAAAIQSVGGVSGLYKGVGYKAFQVTLCKFIYFYAYTWMQNAYRRAKGRDFTPGANLVAGYLGDLAMVPITLPIECVITRLQQAAKRQDDSVTIASIVRDVAKGKGGLLGLYSGLNWQLVVSLLAAVQQTIFDQIRATILRGRAVLSAREALALGAVARLAALVLIYPFMRLKTLVQTSADEKISIAEVCFGCFTGKQKQKQKKIERKKNANANTNGANKTQVLRRNPLALYRGFLPEALRGVLSSALLFMVKESLHSTVLTAVNAATGAA